MTWQTTPFVALLFFATSVSVLLAGYALVRIREDRPSAASVSFLAVTVAAAVWALGYGLQLASVDLAAKLFWTRVAWLGVGTIAVAWPAFVVVYTGRDAWLSPATLSLLGTVPALTVLAIWLPPFREFVIESAGTVQPGPVVVMELTPGPLFLLFVVYSYLVDVLALALLALEAIRSTGTNRRVAAVLIFVGSAPLLGSWLSVAGSTPSGVDVTPFLFAITMPIVGWAVSHYRLLDIVPIARARVLDDLDDGIVVVDGDGRIVDCNETGRRVLDASASEIEGASASDVLARFPSIAAVLDERADQPVEVDVIRDGDHRVYDVSVTEFARESTIPGRVIVFHDITERRYAERRFRTLIEGTADVVSIHDEEGRIEYVSPAVERTLGYDPGDLAGRDALSLVHPEDREAVRATLRAMLEDGGSVRIEYRIHHADGSWRTFETIGENFLDDPVIDGIVFTSRDVTERQQYQQRLQVLNRVLRHDLRNDANVISGNVEMISRAVSDPEALDRLDTIRERTTALVEQSESARLIDHAFQRDSRSARSIDVVRLLEDRLRALEEKYPAVEVERKLPATCDVRADPLLEAAVDRILDNAVRHNDRATPTIVAAIGPESGGLEDYVAVRISDDGPGLPERERRVLEGGTETPLEHASGLGLWFVSWVVDESGGELQFEGNDPRGTTVVVRLRRASNGP